jgi:hypothetical protein
LIEVLDNIDVSDSEGLLTSQFRNCMMHFGLKSKDGVSLIDHSSLDLAIPFCGLVESQHGMSYANYKNKIETELTLISEVLKQYFNLKQ